ncbi:hypothetical protein Tco_1318666 [Tanacetum coccineum]
MLCLRLGLFSFIEVSKPSGSWDELVVSVQCFPSNPSLPLFLYTISPLKGGLGLSDFQVGRVIGAGSGSGLTADSSVLTLTLTFLDFGLDFAQSFPFHAQFCHFGLVFCLFDDIYFLHNTNAKQTSE